jgi:TrmH family RNA methyltransferase
MVSTLNRIPALLEKISSPQNPRIKLAIRLHSSRGRQIQGRIIVFGIREVTRAVQAGVVFDDLFICEAISPPDLAALENQTQGSETRLSMLTTDVFSKINYGDRDSGVVGVGPRPNTELNQLSLQEPLFVVVAQAIEKPGNLGAIIRTADACAVSCVLLADPVTDSFHPNSIRSSTGTVFGMPTATGSTKEIQNWLQANQCRVLTAVLENAKNCFAADLTGNVAIVVGNEANGLSNEWMNKDYSPVKLPMQGRADSLNVSVTASVMIYEATRQRLAANQRA